MTTNELTFVQTWSVAQFKQNNGVDKIDIMMNEKTGKCFFVFGVEKGACSKRVGTGEVTVPVISKVCAPETGDVFYLLHQQGEGGATTLATL